MYVWKSEYKVKEQNTQASILTRNQITTTQDASGLVQYHLVNIRLANPFDALHYSAAIFQPEFYRFKHLKKLVTFI